MGMESAYQVNAFAWIVSAGNHVKNNLARTIAQGTESVYRMDFANAKKTLQVIIINSSFSCI